MDGGGGERREGQDAKVLILVIPSYILSNTFQKMGKFVNKGLPRNVCQI